MLATALGRLTGGEMVEIDDLWLVTAREEDDTTNDYVVCAPTIDDVLAVTRGTFNSARNLLVGIRKLRDVL